MAGVEELITEHIDVWTSAVKRKSSAGRGGSKKIELYGVKKLRALILDLAVRGLLVPQDSSDEPAIELLNRIVTENTKRGNTSSSKPTACTQFEDEEKPFDLPAHWEFTKFTTILDFNGGSQPPKNTFSNIPLKGYIQLIQIRDLGPNPQPVYVPEDKVSKLCTPNDIMIGRYGASVGKVFWGKDGAYNVALVKLNNNLGVYKNKFLYILMQSSLGQRLFSGISRSAQAGFSKRDIENKLLPVMSHAEQQRIVAKVDELMALCDQLELQTESSITAHQTLVETLLGALTQSTSTSPSSSAQLDSHQATSQDTFEQAWQRIAEHFDTLFTTEQSVELLKQSILQLAVMGKLVPQDPDDEPASELLKRIAVEKAELVAAKVIKKQKALPEIGEGEKRFDLPPGWEWSRLEDLVEIYSGITKGRKLAGRDGSVR